MYRFGVRLNVLLSSSVAIRRFCRSSRSAGRWLSAVLVRHFSRQPGLSRRLYDRCQPFTSNVSAEPFLDGTSAVYLEELYADWLEDPSSVHTVSTFECTRTDTHFVSITRIWSHPKMFESNNLAEKNLFDCVLNSMIFHEYGLVLFNLISTLRETTESELLT